MLHSSATLTFAELEATTCLWTSGFLTLNLTAVASDEAFGTQSLLVFCVNLHKCASNGQTQGLRLTGEATPIKIYLNIILLHGIQQRQPFRNFFNCWMKV